MKSLLLLDVDGVLNINKVKPTRRPAGFETFWIKPKGFKKELNLWMNPAIGKTLLDFATKNDLELAWCTTWQHEANEFISPAVGLPQLPVVEFPMNQATAKLWKFHGVEKFVKGKPFIWFDDQFKYYKKAKDYFLFNRTAIPTLLHEINPDRGITQEDFTTVESWLNAQ